MRLRACVLVAVLAILSVKLRRGDSPAPVEPVKLDAPERPVVAARTPTPPPALPPIVTGDDPESDDEPTLAEPEGDDEEASGIIVDDKPLPAGRGSSIHGRMRDAESGEVLAGVTVVATSPVLAQTQSAITDDNGYYLIGDLPTGEYLVTSYYLESTLEHPHVWVSRVAAAVVEEDILTDVRAEPIVITMHASSDW
jgi:hypothetical protein